MVDARWHLSAIANRPRPAGSAAEAGTRSYCQCILEAAGLEVHHRAFYYSSVPGRWGTPVAGLFTALLFLTSGHLGAHLHPRAALGLLLAGALLLGSSAFWLSRWGVLDLPFGRLRGNNLIATRGVPELWLVAHLDSKSQPVPILVRALAIMASIVLWLAGTALAVAQLAGAAPPSLWIPITILGVLASIPVAASVVGVKSHGALDDASGVATILRATELLPRDAPIGVLLTSAEELGLAGARAWAREVPRGRAINVDGIDDTGALRLIYSRRLPRALLSALGPAWPAPSRLLPGALMDGVALADAGWEVVNVSKGSWRTVSRIHTRRDDLAHLDGSGAEEVAALIAGAVTAGSR